VELEAEEQEGEGLERQDRELKAAMVQQILVAAAAEVGLALEETAGQAL